MATLFDENRFESEIDSKVKSIVKNELPKTESYRAVVVRQGSDGVWWVRLDGNNEATPVLVNKVDMSVGDVVTVVIDDHVTIVDGNLTSPPMSASNTASYVDDVVARNISAVTARIGYLEADTAKIGYAQIEEADITNARIQTLTYDVEQHSERIYAAEGAIDSLEVNALTANSATITNLQAETAKLENVTANDLEAATGYIADLTAENISASDIIADHVVVDGLDANYAHITNGTIDNATIGYADVDGLNANYAHITNGAIDNAKIGYADVNGLNANYAQINLANVNNAWIQNGVVKDAAITDAQIIGVSANKLTAGTIDADTIHVTNLSTDNLKVKKINGQPVLGGYSAVSNKMSGYSSKNPSTEGWYELNAGNFVLSQDTAVNASKVYYSQTDSVSLYDQDAIDGMVDDLNDRIDAQIETWTEDHVPTLNNSPASSWTTNDLKAEHVGDICYVLNASSNYDGYTYRFAYDQSTSSYGWVLIKDNQVTAALGRITDLETFESTTTSWISETDEGLETIRTNHTTLSGVVDKTVVESIQLWYTKADTTAPSKPYSDDTTSHVTSTSTDGNAWRVVVPAWNASYPYYFYCWQYKLADGKYRFSAVVRDLAMEESQAQGRLGVANAATADGKAVSAQTTANANIKSSVMLWYTSNSTTPPSKPYTDGSTSYVSSTSTAGNTWTTVVPTYSSSTPKYHYCYQQQRGDGTYQWTTPVYDDATTTAMAKAQAALPQSTYNTFVSTTFKDVKDTVDEQATTITNLSTAVQYGGVNLLSATPKSYASGNYESYKLEFSEPLEVGEKYTVQFWGVDVSHSAKAAADLGIFVYIGGGSANTGVNWKGTSYFTDGHADYLKGTFTYTQSMHDASGGTNKWLSIYNSVPSVSGTMSMLIARWKLERGPIATPWEYSQGDVTTLSNTVNTVSQTATSNSSTISQLTSTLGTNADGTTAANDVVHRVATTETNLSGITTRVSATEAQIKGQFATSSTGASTVAKTATITPTNSSWARATGSTVTVKFTTANTAASPTLNINSTGAASIRNYAGSALTEAEYKWPAGAAMTFTFDGTYWRIQDSTELTRLSSAESSITQNADKIGMVVASGSTASSVQLTPNALTAIADNIVLSGTTHFTNNSTLGDYVGDAIDDIEIGGRNLLRDTAVARSGTAGQYGAWDVLLPTYSNSYLLDLDEGEYVLSFDWESDTALPGSFYVWIGYGNSSGGGAADMPGSSGGDRFGLGKTSGHVVRKFTWPDANSTYPYFACRPFRDNSSNVLSGITFTITNAKLERGNKATDWTSAPEDASDVSQLIYKQAVSGTTTMSETTTWVTATTESVSADTTGLTPVWTTKRPTYRKNYPVLFVATQRKAVGGAVTCTTPLIDDTETVIDGGNIITNSITATQINTSTITIGSLGGSISATNLIRNGDFSNGTSYWDKADSAGTYAVESDSTHGKALKFVQSAAGNNSYRIYTNISTSFTHVSGKTYSISFYAKALASNTIQVTLAGSLTTGRIYVNEPVTTSWKRYTGTITADASGSLTFWLANAGTLYLAEIMLVHGDMPMDWSPDPRDTQSGAVEYIVGTHGSTATNVWTGVTRETTLTTGKQIAFYMTSAGTSTAATLNLTLAGGGTTGAKNVRLNNSNVTTHYPQYTVLKLTYDGTYWKCDNYDSNNYDRHRINNNVKVGENIARYCIAGYSGIGYKKLVSGLAVDLTYPIAYLNQDNISGQSYAVASGGTTTNFYDNIPGVAVTNTKSGWTGTQYAMCYVKGTLSGKMFTVHSDVFTTTAPTSDDGFAYIPIGYTYSTTQVNFNCDNTVYVFKNGSMHKADTVGNYITADSSGIKVHNADDADNYLHITYEGSELFKDGDSVASFGETARIGKEDAERFVVASSSLTAYKSNGDPYFYVDEDGVGIGSGADTRLATQAAVNAVSDELVSMSGDLSMLYGYVDINSDAGTITLGTRTVLPNTDERPVVTMLAPTGMTFHVVDSNGNVSDQSIASFVVEDGQGKLKVHNAVVLQELQFGNWKWMPRNNGNLSLKWMGA